MSASNYLHPPTVGALYCEHHGWLKGWLHRRLGNAADAADLAQDTFIRLLSKPITPTLCGSLEARAYLRTMGNALCVDLWRRRQVEQAWLQTLTVQRQTSVPSPEDEAIVIETLLEIGRMLGRLPPKAATAFVMAQVDGVPYREIAVQLDVSERMVKKYIAQAMLQCALIETGLAD